MSETPTSPGRSWLSRRNFIGSATAGLLTITGFLLGEHEAPRAQLLLRPPGAKTGDDFLAACVRCLRCVDACPNGCLSIHGPEAGPQLALTPYIHARTRGCTLCGECANTCPTDALTPFAVSRDGWKAGVNMGTARVNKAMCYSYAGRTCGACYRACPLAGEAMKIGVFEKPLVQHDICVGCGLCEQACLHLPQAIRVIPAEVR